MLITGHMPYIFEQGGEPWLLFCTGTKRTSVYGHKAYDYMAWSICAAPLDDLGAAFRIQTGFDARDIECNPTAYIKDGLVHLTFVGSRITPEQPTFYRLHEMVGPSLAELAPAEPLDMVGHCTFNGFDNGTYRCVFIKSVATVFDVAAHSMWRIDVECQSIVRVVPHSQFRGVFLITFQENDLAFRTIIYDFESDTVDGEICADGDPVYKCAPYGDTVYHALRGDDETRTITSGAISIEPIIIEVTKRQKEWKRLDFDEPRLPLGPSGGSGTDAELQYSQLLDAVRDLPDGDDNTTWLKSMAEQNHGGQRCSSRRREKLKYYVREAAGRGLQLTDESDIIAGVLKIAPDAR